MFAYWKLQSENKNLRDKLDRLQGELFDIKLYIQQLEIEKQMMAIVGDREFYYNRFTSSGIRHRGINIDYNKNAFAEDVVQNYEVRE